MSKLILASGSPRRRELLATAGLDFGQMNEIVRILEKECLHGPRPASFDAMKKIITDKIKKEAEK